MNDEAPEHDITPAGKALAPHKEIAVREVGGGGLRLAPENASQAMTFAQMMARSDAAVPSKFRNNPGLCLGVTMDAMQFGFNPFALARSAYEVGGAIGYEAKVYVAGVNSSGFLKRRLRHEFKGEIKGEHEVPAKNGTRKAPAGTLVCVVTGHLIGEDEPMVWETPPLGQITTKNSPLWYSDPKLQLYYYAVRAWTRVYLPEAMLGIRTTDELQDAVLDPQEQKPAPRPTLIDRVKQRREEQDSGVVDVEPETPQPSPEAPTEAASAPAKKARRKKSEPVVEAEAAPDPAALDQAAPTAEPPVAPVVADAPSEEAEVAPRDGDPITVEAALAAFRDMVAKCETRDAMEEARLNWMQGIQHFTRDEQYDLIAEADMIKSRAVLDLRKKKAPAQ